MNLNLFLGAALLVFGIMKVLLYCFGKRLTLSRLEGLREKFGVQKGTWIYFLIYAATPIVIGTLFLLREWSLLS